MNTDNTTSWSYLESKIAANFIPKTEPLHNTHEYYIAKTLYPRWLAECGESKDVVELRTRIEMFEKSHADKIVKP